MTGASPSCGRITSDLPGTGRCNLRAQFQERAFFIPVRKIKKLVSLGNSRPKMLPLVPGGSLVIFPELGGTLAMLSSRKVGGIHMCSTLVSFTVKNPSHQVVDQISQSTIVYTNTFFKNAFPKGGASNFAVYQQICKNFPS
jgi:hypothetical protein